MWLRKNIKSDFEESDVGTKKPDGGMDYMNSSQLQLQSSESLVEMPLSSVSESLIRIIWIGGIALGITLSKINNKMLYLSLIQAITRPVVVFNFLLHITDQFLPVFSGHQRNAILGQPFHFCQIEYLSIALDMTFYVGSCELNGVESAMDHRKAHHLVSWKKKNCTSHGHCYFIPIVIINYLQ